LINRLIFRTIYLVSQENHDNCKIQLNQFTNSNTVSTNKQFISSHFSSGCIQSRRQTSDVTFCGNRAAHVLFTIYPEELNKHSHGTDVAGTHSTVFTKPARTGKRWLFTFRKFAN